MMKTAAEIANHPKARLHRDLVATLRASGSVEGAEQTWVRLRLHPRFWKRIVTYGLGLRERQLQLNKVAFPEANAMEVDAALKAGNNLRKLYELALGHASIAKDSAGRYRLGRKGLMIVKHATAICRKDPEPIRNSISGPVILTISALMLSRLILCLCFLASVVSGQSADSQSPRDVSQQPGPAASSSPSASGKVTYSSVHVDGPYIAMTFDDGPHATLTPKLLDLLARKKIKATFFVLGENAQRHPEILKRAVAEGHEIGNHSWSHPNLGKLSNEALRSQLQRTDDVITQAIGSHPRIMRPPYGELTPKQRQWVNSEFGYKVILWDVDPLDWKEPGPSIVAQRIIHETKAGSIMLSHDIHAQTITAMPETFDALLAKGFKFVTVSELLSLATSSPPPPTPPASTPGTSRP